MRGFGALSLKANNGAEGGGGGGGVGNTPFKSRFRTAR